MIRTSMARGFLVVDENVSELTSPLRDKNFHVIEPSPGLDDEAIMQRLLPGRILVTNNLADFTADALAYEFGVIFVAQGALADPAHAANRISKAYTQHRLKSRAPFILTVGVASVRFRLIEE